MSDRYAVTSLDELVEYEIPGRPRWHRVCAILGVEAFGINARTATDDDLASIRDDPGFPRP